MAARRSISWAAAVRDIKDDRATRADVRSEPLKSFTRGVSLIAWRGRSGRRYVFHTIQADLPYTAADFRGTVLIGADAAGQIVGAHADCTVSLLQAMLAEGAVALHLHGLAEAFAERADMARDLRPLAREVA